MTKEKAIAVDDFSGSNRDGRVKDGAIEDEGVELTVFAAGVGVGRKVAEEGLVEFAAGKTGVENFGVDTCGDGTEMLLVEVADQFAGVALPDGKESGHADASEIFLAVGAEVFEEDVAEGDLADALGVEEAEGFFHACFVDGVDALRGDANFVERQGGCGGRALDECPP